MFEALTPGVSLAWDYLWQSTLFLSLGLVASLALRHRPARAHRLVLLAMLAALVTPVLSQVARLGGWGLLTYQVGHTSAGLNDATKSVVDERPLEIVRAALPSPARPFNVDPSAEAAGPREAGPPATATDLIQPDGHPRGLSSIAWRMLALGAWLIVMGLAAARLIVSWFLGRMVVNRARRLDDETLAAAAASAASRLGMNFVPELRASPQVRCPAIWCWGRRPAILLPEVVRGAEPVDWVGIFCHELAHWVRRDHLAGLAAELLTCLLPWHPLAWWARHRLGQLSELACDDRALSTGLEATDYAESLLGLVPRRRGTMALSAVSSRRGLIGRVRHILEVRQIDPDVGPRWAILSASAMVLAASAIALAQARPKETKVQAADPRDDSRSTIVSKAEASSSKASPMRQMIRGAVLEPGGKPVPGARVLWVGYRKYKVPVASLPKDERREGLERQVILAQSRAEPDGHFALAADFDSREFVSLQVIATAEGFGPAAHYFKKYGDISDPDQAGRREADVNLVLAPETIIRGRLLDHIGMPASGVRVGLVGFRYGDMKRQGMYVGSSLTDEEIPAYWPRSQKTDEDGRFTLGGVPQGSYATLWFSHPDYAVDEVVVNTAGVAPTPSLLQGLRMTPVKPDFTHTLEPPRPVQGRVTDKATRKPLAGILVEMTPMRPNGGRSFYTRTDSDGRYPISGQQADRYITTVYPPGDSGYPVSRNTQEGWPTGAKVFEKDFALERGRIVRGRVIDADSGQPIAGAGIVYRPMPGNPNIRGGFDGVSNPVLSDADGRFTITGLAGAGDLLVESTGDYSRTRLQLGKNERQAVFPQGHAPVNMPDNGEAAPVEIALRKGVTFTARVVGPDGKPVSAFAAYCPELSYGTISRTFSSLDFADGRFVFPGADPARTYRVIFTSARHRLAAVVEIKPDPKVLQPVEIRLQPTARVHGRVVTPSGAPMSEGQVHPMIVLSPIPEPMSRVAIFSRTEFFSNLLETSARSEYGDKPEANGEFAHDALVPGMPYYITAGSGEREAYQRVEPLRPGEDRDLGTITLKERQP